MVWMAGIFSETEQQCPINFETWKTPAHLYFRKTIFFFTYMLFLIVAQHWSFTDKQIFFGKN